MRDSVHNMRVVSAVDAAVYAADTNGNTVDRLGFDRLTFALVLGAGGITFTPSNRIDFVLEHSDDGVTFSPVGADNVLNATPDVNGVVKSFQAAHAANTVDRVGYVDGTIGQKRYVRLRPDFSGTHGTGTPITVVAILGEPRVAPVP